MGSNETRCSSASCGSDASAYGAHTSVLSSRSQFSLNQDRTLASSCGIELPCRSGVNSRTFGSAGLRPAVARATRPRRWRQDAATTAAVDGGATLIRRRAGSRLLVTRLDQLHIEAERLQFADQHVERFGYTGLHGGFALDDGLVNLGAAVYVVGLRRQQLLQDERRAISFQRPDFHLSEALSAELRLSAQRLLSDQRVRTDGARVNLVVHQVRQL